MQTRSVLRFLHATNFRLGQVVSGVGDVPATLKRQLLEAPWRSAEAIFDQAIAHEVDFVLINGDIVPDGIEQVRALSFLLTQFEKLHQYNIEIYWRTEPTARDEWNAYFEWPGNVHFVSENSDFTVTNETAHLATVTGSGRSRSELFTVFLPNSSSTNVSADYTAACGTQRSDSVQAGHTVHCPGATQGLSFLEPGPHGCSLIELDHNNCVSISFLETNAVSWDTLRVTLPGTTATLEATLREHAALPANGTRLLSFVLDSQDTTSALNLETVDLPALRQRLQSTTHAEHDYWVCRIDLGAGMTVAPGTVHEHGCLSDFRQLVHHRGEDFTRTLSAQHALLTTTPQTQLLSQVTRLGAELLS